MEGGTTFRCVTQGFDAAYSAARGAAGERGVDVASVLLDGGERIFVGLETFGFEPAEVLHSPISTHIRYRRTG